MKRHASLNRIYRLVWNQALSAWVAVAECARGRGKSSARRKLIVNVAAAAAALALAMSPYAQAGPTDGQVVAGSGSISQAGHTTTINQSSQNLAINWSDFSVAAHEAVRFNQPNASSIVLNRVLGQSISQIRGAISANGQVFILNPNGVIFGAGAQVDVGGLVASTLSLSNDDFMANRFSFSNNGESGSIINQGTLTAAQQGYIAMLAPQVINEGVISATLGSAVLAAGNQVTLNLNQGSLVGFSIDRGAFQALVDNKQLIEADGGQVFMSAKAAAAITTAMVNNSGIVEARTLGMVNGRIEMISDMAVGSTHVAGKLDASAPNGGDGGFIETSGAHVKIADNAQISTAAPSGNTGSWLIDPFNFTVAASGGDVTGAQLSAALNLTDIIIQTAVSPTINNFETVNSRIGDDGDIFINAAVSWNAPTTLTLDAYRNIEINRPITASDAEGTLALKYGQGASDGVIDGTTATYSINAPVNLQAGVNFRTQLGSSGATKYYYVITELGAEGSTTGQDLQGMQGFNQHYALGADIDASATSSWNAYAGFEPLSNISTPFSGNFEGLGHSITGLTINRPTTDYVGLFGYTAFGNISNVALTNASITGRDYVGALVGQVIYGSIVNSTASGTVQGSMDVGGLVGRSFNSTISLSHASSAVEGMERVGGLLGSQYGSGSGAASVYASYASGNVDGNHNVGGLVGYNSGLSASIDGGHASGQVNIVNAGGTAVGGGLVGANDYGVIYNSYATGNVVSVADLTATFGTNLTGGLVGSNFQGSIENSYASGNVSSAFDLSYNGTTQSLDGYNKVGGLVGLNFGGQVLNSHASGKVQGNLSLTMQNNSTIDYIEGVNKVGGLVGDGFYGVTDASYATGAVSASAIMNVGTYGSVTYNLNLSSLAGGLQGNHDGNYGGVANSHASGNVTNEVSFNNYGSVSQSYLLSASGGLLGSIDNGEVFNSYATGSTKDTGNSSPVQIQVGGLVGSNDYGLISQSHATGNAISQSGYGELGGLVGRNYGSINQSYATGDVMAGYRYGFGYGNTFMGGLVGHNYGDISQTYATGSVTGNGLVGGLVGLNDNGANIDNSYATGLITADEDFGGLVAENRGTVSNSFWDTDTTGVAEGYGIGWNNGTWADGTAQSGVTGLSTLDSLNVDSYTAAGWDFWVDHADPNNNGTWFMIDGETRPFLQSEYSTTITNSHQLQLMAMDLSANYSLANNIEMSVEFADRSGLWATDTGISTGRGFVPLGTYGERFTGSLNGNGYTVTELNINRPGLTGVGLFGYGDGSISNVSLRNVSITGYDMVGGLLGDNKGAVLNSHVSGSLVGVGRVGGLVGYNQPDGSIDGSHTDANVQSSGSIGGVGGLVGSNYGLIDNSHAAGSVTGISQVGGLAGRNANEISQSYATASVSGTSSIGGLAGKNFGNGVINQSYASGAVTGSDYVGGLVGHNQGEISASYALGSVAANNLVGGLVGYNDAGTITQTYATGSVAGNSFVGGLVGLNDNGAVSASFWDIDTTLQIVAIGVNEGIVSPLIGLTTADFLNQVNFTSATYANGMINAGWNFSLDSGTWFMIDGETRPFLQSEYSTTITNSHQLQLMAMDLTADYTLAININMATEFNNLSGMWATDTGASTGRGFVPVGNEGNHYTGNFDGQNHTISGLTINRPTLDGVGLFGYGQSISNVGLLNVAITGEDYVGGLAGNNYGSIANSYVTGTVTGDDFVGGLVGWTSDDSTIANSYSAATVVGIDNVGGLVGYHSGSLTNSYAIGAVQGNGDVGGLVGNNSGIISNTYATGAVQGAGDLGGLVGFNDGTVTNSFWDAASSGQSTSDGGTAKTTSELLTQSTYTAAGWSFGSSPNSGTWFMLEGETRPFLQSEYSTNISNSHQLQLMAMDLNASYTLTNNLDMSADFSNVSGMWATDSGGIGGSGFVPVGNENSQFTGSFNGLNHSISGLNINRTDSAEDIGLFGRANATISNVGLVGANITGGYGSYGVGGLVGYNYGQISNSYVSGVVTGEDNVGGLVGYNDYGSIRNSYASATVIGTGDDVGGLVGDSEGGRFINTYATGNVTGQASVGGLIGENENGSISNSYASGNVTGTDYGTGGLVGYNYNGGTISNSHATGNVFGVSSVGGLVGKNENASVTSSYATGNVSAIKQILIGEPAYGIEASLSVGGLVGYNNQSGIIESYATGSVFSSLTVNLNDVVTGGNVYLNNNVGGLVGFNDGFISRSYATGAASGITSFVGNDNNVAGDVNISSASGGLVGLNGSDKLGGIDQSYATGHVENNTSYSGVISLNFNNEPAVGGLVGFNYNGYVEDSFWDTTSSGQSTSDGGTAKITADLLMQSTYTDAGWSFGSSPNSGTWFMLDGETRPFLQSEYSTSITNSHQLQLMAMDLTANYTLANNINMSAEFNNISGMWATDTGTSTGRGFVPVGNGYGYGNAFTGSFNGLNHTVSGLSINRPEWGDVGLFGRANANISNVGLVGVNVTGGYGSYGVGGLVGNNYGQISNSFVSGAVIGENNVGGLVGFNNNGSISGSYSTATVTGEGDDIGGLVGDSEGGWFTNSYATGNITGIDSVGGLIGENENGMVINSYATGSVIGEEDVGGLVGYNYDGSSISNSYATGSITGTDATGGLVGKNQFASIAESYASGLVSGHYRAGGLVGQNRDGGTISNSQALGNVNGYYGVGGLVGANQEVLTAAFGYGGVIDNDNGSSRISNSYATGNVVGTNSVGGLVGLNDSEISINFIDNVTISNSTRTVDIRNSYATGTVHGDENVGGLVGLNRSTLAVTGSSGSLITSSQSVASINKSYATGAVTITSSGRVGGLLGVNQNSNNTIGNTSSASVDQSYATGSVSGDTFFAGGLIGQNDGGTVTSSFWDIDTTGQLISAGSDASYGKTTAELLMQSTYTDTGWDFSVDVNTPNDTGTWFMLDGETRPFLQSEYSTTIANSHQLQLMAMDLTANYTLANNINMAAEFNNLSGMWATDTGTSTGRGFVPVGNDYGYGNAFTGSFNGLNHTVSGLSINRPEWGDVGLFGRANAKISNVGLVGANITGSYGVGGLVGYNYGQISNSFVSGAVNGENNVGGLVGFNDYGSIRNSYASATVTGSSDDVGGLVGDSEGGRFTNTYATGNVTGIDSVGGLIGENENGMVLNSYATGRVSGQDDVGGLVGYNYDGGTIANSHAAGSVLGDSSVGGLVGRNEYASITSSYALGSVAGSLSNGDSVGGLVGYNYDGSAISNSYADGMVSGSNSVGGLVGWNAGPISNSHAKGLVFGREDQVGGLVGENLGDISNSYASGLVLGSGKVGGLAGSNAAEITNSYASGSVVGVDQVGGLVGYNASNDGDVNANINNSYAIGNVTGSSAVGGLVGTNYGSVSTTYATGYVVGGTDVGGLVGVNQGEITSSVWDTDTTGQALAIGWNNEYAANLVGLSTLDFLNQANFSSATTANGQVDVNWSFGSYPNSGTWFMVDGETRPFLQSEYSTSITNGHQLQLMAMDLNAHYTLANNVDLTADFSKLSGMWATDRSVDAGKGFVEIGNDEGRRFTGGFDGLGHTISGLYINRPLESDVALFGYGNANISNVGLVDVNVTANSFVAGLVADNYGRISNSYVTGTVTGLGDYVGGLVATNVGSISDSHTDVEVTGASTVGGLVGVNQSTASIVAAYALGDVAGSGNDVGGLLGHNWSSVAISHSHASGDVQSTGGNSVGGLVGFSESNTAIENSYATGNVTGYGHLGGLVGHINYGAIRNSYATGDVTSTTDADLVGGLLGYSQAEVNQTYSTGLVSSGGNDVGGLVGQNDGGNIANSYWNNTVNSDLALDNDNGVGLSSAEMRSRSNFVGFNFTSTPGASGNNWVLVNDDGTLNNAGDAAGATTPMLASEYATSIGNAHQLQLMAMDLSADYTLAHNIDASRTAGLHDVWTDGGGFVPVGSYSEAGGTEFTGSFNGLNHRISGLSIDRSNNSVGLFGRANANISNLGLVDVAITGGYGSHGAGGLVGYNDGVISNSFVTGTVNGSANVGGLVGFNNYGRVSNSYSAATVVGSSDDVGGLVGDSEGGYFANNYATGNVTGWDSVGGLIGENENGVILNSYATGSVNGVDAVGGLVGYNYSGSSISNSYATGSVAAATQYGLNSTTNSLTVNGSTGGLVGQNENSAITDSYAIGSVSGSMTVALYDYVSADYYGNGDVGVTNYVGGLVGSNVGGNISNSYAIGAISSSSSFNTNGNSVDGSIDISNASGGLVGFNDGVINNSYTTGSVASSSETYNFNGASGEINTANYLGGLVGINEGQVNSSFWDIHTTGQINAIGSDIGTATTLIGLTTQDFLNQANFTSATLANNYVNAGWSFGSSPNSGTWFMIEGETRPFLQSEYSTSITNSHHLQLMAMDLSANYTLANNIAMSAEFTNAGGMWATNTGASTGRGFVPIGAYDNAFTGHFDGQGHSISGFTVYRDASNGGLFGYNQGVVSHVGLVDVDVSGADNVGGLVGVNAGLVDDSFVTGEVSGSAWVGGLVGVNGSNKMGAINDSYAIADVSASQENGSYKVGGLVGSNFGNIAGSYANGAVNGDSGSRKLGGLAGSNYNSISKSYAAGDVAGTYNVGGLVGSNYGEVNGSHFANGTVTALYSAGGLVGFNYGEINNSYAAAVDVIAEQDVGGLVGYNQGTLSNSFYNAEAAPINGLTFSSVSGILTVGGLYSEQYGDWIRHNKTLNAEEYFDANLDGAFEISSVQDFKDMLGFSQNGNLSFVQTAALDLTADAGLYVPYFAGLYHGNDYSLENAYIDVASNNNIAVFGELHGSLTDVHATNVYVNGGRNVGGLVGMTVYDSAINISSVNGVVSGYGGNVGGLAGSNHGYINATHANVTLTGGAQANNVGGLVGVNYGPGNIIQSSANGDVSASINGIEGGNVGGLVGLNYGVINSVNAHGNVIASYQVGGLVGANFGEITDGYAYGNVTGAYDYVGGLVGLNSVNSNHNANASISSSGAYGSVSGRDYVGGLIGANIAKFEQYSGEVSNVVRIASVDTSYALGNVTGVDYVGGLVGQNRSLLFVSNAATVTGIDFDARITNSHAIGNVTGEDYVGGLVGINDSQVVNTGSTIESSSSASISSSYAVGGVSGAVQVGGLVGANRNSLEGETTNTTSEAAITFSYAVGNALSAGSLAGGLVGANDGLIDNSYATGYVFGNENIGGLVGLNDGEIRLAYSTGFVDGSLSVGGLVGSGSGLVTNSFWNTDNSGLSISAGGTGLSSEQMKQAASFSSWGNAINNTGEGDVSWRVYEGQTTPLLRAFMEDLVLSNTNVIYNGSLQAGEDVPTNGNRSGTAARGIDVGTYLSYSDQQGYNIVGGSLVIDPIPLTAISLNGTRVYDGTVDLDASIFNLLGVLDGESLTLTGTGFMDDRHVGVGKIVNLGTLALGDCSDIGCSGLASNYTFSGGTQTVTITPKALSQSGLSVASSKVYDGTRNAVVLGSASFVSETVGTGNSMDGLAYTLDTVSLTGTAVGTYNDKDVADATTVSFSGMSLTGVDANNYSLLAHADAAATITQKSLTQSGLSVANSKVYDSTTDAVVLGSVSLHRIAANLADAADGAAIVGDEVSLVGTAIGAYNDKDVADATTVSFSGMSLTGGDANNYSLLAHADAAATITQKSLTQSGLSVSSSKVYDGTTDAVVMGSVSLQTVAANLANANDGAVIEGDDVSLVGTAIGFYNDKDVTDAMRVTISGLTLNGTDVNNYSFAAPVLVATITPKALSQSGLSVASSKVYDGTRNAVVLGSASFGSQDVGSGDANDGMAYNGDAVSITGAIIGTYNDKDVADATTVSFSGMSLTGADANNYSLLAHADAAATITQANALITANSGTRYYNGLLRSISGFAASGLQNGETLSVLSGVSAYGSGVEIGTYPVVASGTDGNYHLTFIDGLLTIEKGTPAAFLSVIGAALNSLAKSKDGQAGLQKDNADENNAEASEDKVNMPKDRLTSLKVSTRN